jgi:hypothetical protein
MKTPHFLKLFLGLVALLSMLSIPTMAQELAESTAVSGTFSYTYENPMLVTTEDETVLHGIESEIWSGDLEGTGDAIWRVTIDSDIPHADVWIIIDFSGTLLGEYEGTLTIMLVGERSTVPNGPIPAQWYGEWTIVDGTGDLANVHGSGIWWGPGNRPNDPSHDIPDIAYSGKIVFMNPVG